jgi:hypothetical protein
MAARTTTNCRRIEIVTLSPVRAAKGGLLLLELGILESAPFADHFWCDPLARDDDLVDLTATPTTFPF